MRRTGWQLPGNQLKPKRYEGVSHMEDDDERFKATSSIPNGWGAKLTQDSWMLHNIDFQAVTGPGGVAKATTCKPGEKSHSSSRHVIRAFYVYHCAVPPVAAANGQVISISVKDAGLSNAGDEGSWA